MPSPSLTQLSGSSAFHTGSSVHFESGAPLTRSALVSKALATSHLHTQSGISAVTWFLCIFRPALHRVRLFIQNGVDH